MQLLIRSIDIRLIILCVCVSECDKINKNNALLLLLLMYSIRRVHARVYLYHVLGTIAARVWV